MTAEGAVISPSVHGVEWIRSSLAPRAAILKNLLKTEQPSKFWNSVEFFQKGIRDHE